MLACLLAAPEDDGASKGPCPDTPPPAINPLAPHLRIQHHEAMAAFGTWCGTAPADHMADFLGVFTHRAWDCTRGLLGYSDVPNRRAQCEAWAGARWRCSELPLVDEEYFQCVVALEPHIGHNYIGHNHKDHNYIGHNYVGRNYIGLNYIGGSRP